MPYNLENVEPIYQSFDGWDNSIGVCEFDKLPENAKIYIKFVESFIKTKISIISTGPDRKDTIFL
jgi:adenylosuccinate synthase